FVTKVINDGQSVVSWVKGNRVDLIKLDLMLPGKNGLDIYRELRTFTGVPVVMATGRVDDIDRLIGLELGA
ncbi:response regulator, partial [Psychromonas aquatilis]